MPKDKTRKPRHSDAQVIAALQASAGVMAHAARKLGIGRSMMFRRVHENEKVKAAWEEAKETNIDLAETKLMQAIQNGELPAIFFFLKCQAKHRGYIERKELDANLAVRPLPPIEDDGWLG